ncbi:MAG: GDSL-type esterase/lipase family protein [Pirellulaceae bacterium]
MNPSSDHLVLNCRITGSFAADAASVGGRRRRCGQNLRSACRPWLMLMACVLLVARISDAEEQAVTENVQLRGDLNNCRIEFERNHQGHVAFLGGSITEMNGYRPMVMAWLEKRFPDVEFTFTNAGISSTCSTTGAFRLAEDVLAKGPVDLLFVEYAVNDDQDAHHARRECIRGLEGVLRQLWRHNPHADVVVTYFVNPEMLEQLQAGKEPLTMAAHGRVAEHYHVSTIHLAREVAQRIDADRLTWQQYGGTHPKPAGNAIAAQMIAQLFEQAWNAPLAKDGEKTTAKLPEPLDSGSYERGRYVDLHRARIKQGWRIHVPAWDTLKGSKRNRFTEVEMLCATEPGAELTLEFDGAAVGAYLVAGPDAGILEASIDGGEWKRIDLFHHYSAGLHYPRTVLLASDLSPGRHTLVLRVSKETNSAGHAARILHLVAN